MGDFTARLKSYQQAVDEEFKKDVTDPKVLRDETIKLFADDLPAFAKRLRYIAEHAEKDSDALAAIKFAFEFVMGSKGKGVPQDEMQTLIDRLMAE